MGHIKSKRVILWFALTKSSSFLLIPRSAIAPVFKTTSNWINSATHVTENVLSYWKFMIFLKNDRSCLFLHHFPESLKAIMIRCFVALVSAPSCLVTSIVTSPWIPYDISSSMEGQASHYFVLSKDLINNPPSDCVEASVFPIIIGKISINIHAFNSVFLIDFVWETFFSFAVEIPNSICHRC